MLTYGALCELAARHGVTITENVRAFVREVEEEDRRAIPFLAADHKGMRVDYCGLLGQTREGLFKEPALAEMIRQLQDHIAELGRRWYAGDTAVVDELLQLYCVEQDARAAVAARPTVMQNLTVQPEHSEASAPGLSEEALDTSLLWYLNHELGRALSEAKSPNLSRLHVTTLMELVNRALTNINAKPSSTQVPVLSEFEIRDLAVKYCAYETDGKCYNIVRYQIEEDFFNFCRALISLALTHAGATKASPDARIEELRKGLFEARDAMRVMSNWVKQSDPAGHSWGVRMVDRANAVLSGAAIQPNEADK